MLPRLLRVSRAKTPRKVAGQKMKLSGQNSDRFKAYRPKIPSRVQSLTGRASKLLGRAGAAQLRYAGNKSSTNNVQGIAKTPGSLVFEGYRASGNQGKGALKTTGRAKKHGKPSNRSRSFKAEGKKRGKA